MNATQLKRIVCDFIEKPNKGNAILIDGPWGCGKTYEIYESLMLLKNGGKRNKKDNEDNEENKDNEGDDLNSKKPQRKKVKIKPDHFVYVSLFGLESIDEIHSDIYQKYNHTIIKTKRQLNGALGIVSKAASFIGVRGIEETLKLAANITDEDDEKEELDRGPFIVFFDDLERLSHKISYVDLLGYFNNRIFQFGGRIVCLCNQEAIKNKKRAKDFESFKEKVFDREYRINEDVRSAFDEVFKGIEIENIQGTYSSFKSNIRSAKKTASFYKELIGHIDKSYEKYESVFPRISIFEACKKAIDEVLNEKSDESKKEETKDSLTSTKALELAIRKVFLHLDYSDLDSLFRDYDFERGKNVDSVFNQEYFLLSEENKEKYRKALYALIYGKQFSWTTGFQTKLGSFLFCDDGFELNDSQLEIIAEKVEEWQENHDGDDAFAYLSLSAGCQGQMNKIKEKIKIIQADKYRLKIEKAFSTNDFGLLQKYVDKLYPAEKQDSLDLNLIFGSDFYLPDLKGDMTPEQYSYSVLLSQLLGKAGSEDLKQKFIDKLDELKSQYPNDQTLKQRVKKLIGQI